MSFVDTGRGSVSWPATFPPGRILSRIICLPPGDSSLPPLRLPLRHLRHTSSGAYGPDHPEKAWYNFQRKIELIDFHSQIQ